MKQKLIYMMLPFMLPLAACGQTPSNKAEHAQPASENAASAITANLEKAYASQKLKVQSVNKTPINGLYEVVVSGNQIIYTDDKAKYILQGSLLDVEKRRDLTEERMADLSTVDFASLPLDKAIKEVRGKGTLKVAVFSDPDCPFCKRLEREFTKMNDITIYSFMMPLASLHPDAARKAEQIWCQPNRTAAWTAWMREGKMPPQVKVCDNPVEETTSLGEQLGFHGTPAIVFPNGKTQNGYSPMPQLEQIIKQNQ
ncbi:DsbC family protein [Neisseria dumasiana]|uniref:Thiol:disulfide interchange protein n=1 Tax=Neisseria dumasiana TaxID=1931275 RepID=A0A1X3DKJ4_9NEIS|nr:DsbC family protein [Neisseria dumasiana]OSI24688.1 thiol:disulfide interchange protein [Neisseria dumasiana]